jgi:hypothetical protein
MNLKQWRSTPAAIEAANKLKGNETYKQMLDVAHNELPTNRTLPVMGAKDTDFVYAYGIEVGYRNCLAVLAAMSEPMPEEKDITPDFSSENNDDE